MALHLLPLKQHEYYWHGFGSVTEDCCYNHQDHPGMLHQTYLLRWSLLRSNTGGTFQERWLKDVFLFTFVLQGTVEFHDKFRGYKRVLYPGDFWSVDTASGFFLNMRFSANTMAVCCWFDSSLKPNIFQSQYGKVPLQINRRRSDQVRQNAYNFESLRLNNEHFTLRKINELIIPPNELNIPIDQEVLYILYLLQGKAECNDQELNPGDFVTILQEDKIRLKTEVNCRVLVSKYTCLNRSYLS